ncbi:MAG: glycosyltransferase family 1 protein [Candidatus Promineifilaceae bacterium]|nr:glycosyltransferase family 1 protein [Candidatus Promineifilaceae bacterium]
MRVGIDLRLPTYRMGGISQYALHLLPALAALEPNGDLEFILYHSRKESRSFVPRDQPDYRRRNLWTPCHHRFERWTLGIEIVADRLDVFHSPDFIPPAWGARRKIITIHDLNFIFYPQFLTAESRRYYLDQIQWAADTADHISVDSHATRKDVIEILGVPEEKVTTVHLAANTVYTDPYSTAQINESLLKYHLRPGFVLFVGTLEPRKNLPTLLQVYHRLRTERNLEVPLILAGALGWETDEIFKTIDELDLKTDVQHLPGLNDYELAHLYHAAGVLVTPSYYEGFGLPALEAQHCHCPVVVSNRGSLPEIVGDQGIALDPDDQEVWVSTLDRVLHDESFRMQMVDYGIKQASRFSWQSTAMKTLDIYLGK